MTRASVSAAVKKSLQFLFAVFSLFIYRLEVFADVVIPGDPVAKYTSGNIFDLLVFLVPILLIVLITVALLKRKHRNKKKEE